MLLLFFPSWTLYLKKTLWHLWDAQLFFKSVYFHSVISAKKSSPRQGYGLWSSTFLLRTVSVKPATDPYCFFLLTLHQHTTFRVERCYHWNTKINRYLHSLKAYGTEENRITMLEERANSNIWGQKYTLNRSRNTFTSEFTSMKVNSQRFWHRISTCTFGKKKERRWMKTEDLLWDLWLIFQKCIQYLCQQLLRYSDFCFFEVLLVLQLYQVLELRN